MNHVPFSMRKSTRHSIDEIITAADAFKIEVTQAELVDAAIEIVRKAIEDAGDDYEAVCAVVSQIRRNTVVSDWRESCRTMAALSVPMAAWAAKFSSEKEGV